MKRLTGLLFWAALAVVVYAYIVKWPSPELWQWITH